MQKFKDDPRKGERAQVIILLTDGRATAGKNEMQAMLTNLTNTDIKAMAVGIGGQVDRNELKRIASGEGDENVFEADDYELLKAEIGNIVQSTCDGVLPQTPTAEPVTTPASTTPAPTTPAPTTSAPPTTPIPTLEPPVCKSKPQDIYMVVDTSKSINDNEIKRVREAVKLFFEYIDVGPHASRVGLIKYNKIATEEFGLDEYTSNAQLKALNILSRGKIDGGTRTDIAMLLAMQKFKDDPRKGERAQVIILLTDGRATAGKNEMQAMLTNLTNTDIKAMAVGIGGQVDRNELRRIATGEGDENVFEADDYELLKAEIGNIVQSTCDGVLPQT